jgi:general secretion pathway protein E
MMVDSSTEESNVISISALTRKRLPFGFAKRFGVLLSIESASHWSVFYKKSTPVAALTEARRFAEHAVHLQLLSDEEFEKWLSKTYQNDSAETMQMVEGIGDDLDLASLADAVPETEDLLEQEGDAPIIRLINALLTEAVKENASDIHIETFEKRLVVRFRVDGTLREVVQPKRALAPLLVSRIKVMAKLDIAEKRLPQDGRITLRVAGREVDIRVSTIPSSYGERVVLRLLDKQAGRLDLQNLGMDDHTTKVMNDLIHKPHGILLVTGPTGSGKTTTLYAALDRINDRTRNIMTVEDPIEYHIEGIGQTQVNTKVEMTFARGLRAILRQDPDVVMIGEIRDLETAQIAVQSSLTGHLVLSTLHTNTAVGAVTRLHDMGIEPFLLSSSLLGILAQRLVRMLCPHCKKAYTASEAECELMHVDKHNPPEIYHAVGCDQCRHLGYRGRKGIYELVSIDETMRTLIHNQVSEQELEKYARSKSLSLRDDGCRNVLLGYTTLEEVLRVSKED